MRLQRVDPGATLWPDDLDDRGTRPALYSDEHAEFIEQVTASRQEPGDNDAADAPWLTVWAHPGPVSEQFFNSDEKVIAMRGPVGSGKTTANLRSRFRRAIMSPRSVIDGVRRYKVVIARATYRQLWQTTIPSWWEIVPKNIGTWSGGRGDPVTHRIEWEDEFGKVEFTAEFLAFGESPAEITANMRGLQCTDLALEEADTCHVTVMTVGSTRINRFPQQKHFAGYSKALRSYGQIAMTYNATDLDNWLVKTVERDGEDDISRAVLAKLDEGGIQIRFFRQPGYGESGVENTANLAPDYYPAQIKIMRATGKTDDIERLIYNRNSFVVVGDLVFRKTFNPRIHVSSEPLEPWPGIGLRLGFDQGFKGAMVVTQFRPPYHWQVLGEVYFPGQRLFAHDFGREARRYLDEHFPGLTIERAIGDMAGAGEKAESEESQTWNRLVGEHLDVFIEAQTTGNNRIQPRLEAIRAALAFLEYGQPGLLIDGRACPGLTRAFQARYVWAEEVNAHGDKVKVPDKSREEANIMDALQYVIMSEMHVPGLTAATGTRRPRTGISGHNGGPPLDDALPEPPSYSFDPLNDYQH